MRYVKWIHGEEWIAHCSECGEEMLSTDISNYCPKCGVKMEEKMSFKIAEIENLAYEKPFGEYAILYGACVKIARDMGYEKIITYILENENGASLKAANFTCEGKAGGTIWTGSRKRDNGVPQQLKQRYVFNIA